MHSLLRLCAILLATLCCVCGSSVFYTDNDLGQSVPVGPLTRRQKKEVKQEILQLMGLYSMPKRHTKEKVVESATEFMKHLYNSITEDEASHRPGTVSSHIHIDSNFNASGLGLDLLKVEGCDTIISFANRAKKVSHLRHEKDRTFYFDFSKVSVGENVKGAELRLYKEVSDKQQAGSFVITLYRIKQGRDWEDKELEEVVRMVVDWNSEGWLTLDVTSAAEEWTYFPYSNMGLYLRVTDSYGHEYEPRDIGLVDRHGVSNKQPFLVGYMQMSEELRKRRTRSIHNRQWTNPSTSAVTYDHNPYTVYSRHKRSYPRYVSNSACQRHNLYIDFKEIGMDEGYLIAPEGYRAFTCVGKCSFPLGIHMNSTNHAIVQTLVHLLKPKAIPQPCCAPTEYAPMRILYYNSKDMSISLDLFREMIVEACGCH